MWRWLRRYLIGQPAVPPDTAGPESDSSSANTIVKLLSDVSEDKNRAAVLKDTVANLAVVFTLCACLLLAVLFAGISMVIVIAVKELAKVPLHYAIPLGAGGGVALGIVTLLTISARGGVKILAAILAKILKGSKGPGASGE